MTEYVVLQSNGEGDWSRVELRVKARSAHSAIREHISQYGVSEEREDRYVAIPARSWKPVTVKVETKTALKFS